MPTFALTSDIHGSHYDLVVPRADYLIHAGDFSTYGHTEDTADFLRWMEAQPHRTKIAIAGNHDKLPYQRLRVFNELLVKHAPSVIYLQDSTVEIDGLVIHGSPFTPAFLDWHFMADRGPDIQRHWDMIPDNVNVLISHGPPMGIHDGLPHDFMHPEAGSQHVGCANLTTTIRERLKDLKLAVHGHIHLHSGAKTMRDGVLYVNASALDESYDVVTQPIVVNL